MLFGICAPLDKAADIKSGGADFIEENVQGLLQGRTKESDWEGYRKAAAAPLPILAANCLVPAEMKIVGSEIDTGQLLDYITNVMQRAGRLKIKTLVFGSGGARNVPGNFDRDDARRQIMDFLQMIAPLAAEAGVALVVEPLNKKECNIINTVGEAMSYVREINHPNIRCLVDSYHYWIDGDNPDDLVKAMPWIAHVHVADKDGRLAPGESGTADYRPFFKIIKNGGYDGPVCVEALGIKDYQSTTARVLAFLKRQWNEA
ncbi:MAG: sugar phosphate isomerase/epimerase family protein [Tepidisphaeraceae bacterium]|jgi:sugar phosphate isomerase/epimerase